MLHNIQRNIVSKSSYMQQFIAKMEDFLLKRRLSKIQQVESM